MRKIENLLNRLERQEILFCDLSPVEHMRVVFVHHLKQLAYCMANSPDATMDFYYSSIDQALGDEVARMIYPLMREEYEHGYQQGLLDAEHGFRMEKRP